jgi:hypothetical protein
MALGTWTMACLLLVSGTVPPDVSPINQRKFEIPIRIDPARRAGIKELKLYSSTDEGRTWHLEYVADPDKTGFTFFAPTDGIYWFSVQVLDQQGHSEPDDIYRASPGQKVLVDTLKPLLRIVSAERQGEDVAVSWEIQEDHPDLATLKLDYRAADADAFQWQSAPVSPDMHGQARVHVSGPSALTIRMQVQDVAGNLTTTQTEVAAAPAPAGNPVALGSSAGPTASAIGHEDKVAPIADPPAIRPSAKPIEQPPLKPTGATSGDPVGHPDILPPPPLLGTGTGLAAEHGAGTHGSPALPIEPRGVQDRSPWPGTGSSPRIVEPGTHLVASSETSGLAPASGLGASAAHAGHDQLPSLQVINSTQVTLEYEVAKFGPSGVGSVEVYLTRDDGATWQRYAADQEVRLPPSAEMATPGSIRRPITVELPGEGVYGFYLVVRSGAGLGKPPPQNGDAPQMRIEVDTTRPVAQLYAPEPIPGHRDQLAINWTASDHNLGATPITLQWAAKQGGPWETIGADLANSGRFTWNLPPNLPSRVFLRLTARDTAGNVGIAETREPVLVDLCEPEIQIVGFKANGQRP